MSLETREHERARKFRDHALAAMQASGAGPSPVEAEALVKLGLLLAAEVPPEDADIVLEGLVPYGPQLQDDTKQQLCRVLVMRGRAADAESLWDTMDPTPRMQAQLGCLTHRLLEVAEHHGDDYARLLVVTEQILSEPLNHLAALVERPEGSEEDAVVAYVSTRLLARIRSVVEANAPIMSRVWDELAGPSRNEEEEAALDEAAEMIARDMLAYEGPGEPARKSGSPIIDWLNKVTGRNALPGRGRPAEPKGYLDKLQRLLLGTR